MSNPGKNKDNPTAPKVIVLPKHEGIAQPVPGTLYLAMPDGRLVPVKNFSCPETYELPLNNDSALSDTNSDKSAVPLKITNTMSLAPSAKRGGQGNSGLQPTKKVKLSSSVDDTLNNDGDGGNSILTESDVEGMSDNEENVYGTPEYLYDELDYEENYDGVTENELEGEGGLHSSGFEQGLEEAEEAYPEEEDDFEAATYNDIAKQLTSSSTPKTPTVVPSASNTTSSRVLTSQLPKTNSGAKGVLIQKPNVKLLPSTKSSGIAIKNTPKFQKPDRSGSELGIPSNFDQYGESIKTRLGKHRFGFTLTDPPSQFFQGVLKSGSGKTLAVMFADTHLLAKLEGLPIDNIGDFVIDNTFRAIPDSTKDIKYMLTVNIIYQNRTYPLWMALMSCSSSELYKRILLEFQQYVLDWPFKTILLNNDPVLCKAVQTVFPDAQLYGSWFYYCYSIWKEVSLHGLAVRCKTNPTLMKAVKMLMVLPYLPPLTDTFSSSLSMLQGFQVIKEFARENNLPVEFDKVLYYVANFWFAKVKTKNFTVHGKHTSMLNNVETIQLALLSFMKTDATIWTLTHSLQSVTKSAHSDFIRFMNGKPVQAKRNRGRRFNLAVKKNIRKLSSGSMSVKTYLEQSTAFCEDVLDIFLHPVYPVTADDPNSETYVEGWKIRIRDT